MGDVIDIGESGEGVYDVFPTGDGRHHFLAESGLRCPCDPGSEVLRRETTGNLAALLIVHRATDAWQVPA